MAPPAWAYQVDNFQPPPDEELVCSICQAIFCDPVQSPCNHVFCRACIAKWLETNRNCPICRKRTTRTTLQEVVPIVKNMIMKLVLRCHNSERGCKARFSLESCEAHVKDCLFELVQCKNRPCKQMCVRKDIRDHETNSCPHSYVRCSLCKLKISSRSTSAHSCIDELRTKLREKDDKLKAYREKLKKLKEELKNMRESEDFTSDSSVISISPAEILFNFTENSNLSEFSSISSDESVNLQSSADESEVPTFSNFRPTRESMMFELEQLQERINDHFGQIRSATDEGGEDNNSSIEYPRVSSPTSLDDSSVLVAEPAELFLEEEPEGLIRPAKRRLVTQVLDSSDEDEQLEVAPQPSRKRTLQHQGDVISSTSLEPVAGPSYRSSNVDSSTSNNDSSPSNHRNRFKLRPKLKSRSVEWPSAPGSNSTAANPVSVAQSGNPVFERTLSLLEQYNLESDPEWLPPALGDESDASESHLYVVPGHTTSTDESSSSDLESESSYEDAAEGRTEDLLNSFYGSSDSDEWLPHY